MSNFGVANDTIKRAQYKIKSFLFLLSSVSNFDEANDTIKRAQYKNIINFPNENRQNFSALPTPTFLSKVLPI